MNHRRKLLQTLAGLALLPPGLTMAQGNQPGVVRLLVGFPPGATGDRIARVVAPVLAASLQSNVVVENKSGAGGQLAVSYAQAGPADGSVLLQTIGSSMVIYPHTYRNLPYDPFRDFVPIGTVATAPIAFVCAPTVPAKTLKEAVELIRKNPKLGFYGTPASGSAFHFSGVLLQRALGSVQRPRIVHPGLLGYVLPGASMRWPAPVASGNVSVLKGRVNGQHSADAIRQGQ